MSKNYLAGFRAGQTKTTTVPKFEMGGAAPAGAPGAAPEAGGGDPTAQLSQMVAQFAQTQDPQLAVQIANALVQMMGGGQAAPEQAAPAGDPAMGGAPMAQNGMKLRVFKKGGKAPAAK